MVDQQHGIRPRASDSVLCIDSCATERRTRAFLDAVDACAAPSAGLDGARGARLLVNTHQHGDHTNGNCLMPDATIIGHHRCREAIEATGILRPDGLWEPVDWGELEPAPPFVTFEHRLDVYVDDLLVELHHFGTAAHTTNDVVAWIPEHRVLFTGDLVFNGGTPFVLMGSVAGSLVALDCVMELEPAVIVPGHGEVCGPEVVDIAGEYLRFLQQIAGGGQRRPGSPPSRRPARPTSGASPPSATPSAWSATSTAPSPSAKGHGPGTPSTSPPRSCDMVTLNGGRPLTCQA